MLKQYPAVLLVPINYIQHNSESFYTSRHIYHNTYSSLTHAHIHYTIHKQAAPQMTRAARRMLFEFHPTILNVDDRDRDQQATSFNLRTNTTRDCFESTVRPYGISPIACLLSAMTLRSSALPPKL
ncbi:hypothetical protein DINM_004641 [Dirofilaria immitis]|nr:hypothetical protein [Dirofilaria immitis]